MHAQVNMLPLSTENQETDSMGKCNYENVSSTYTRTWHCGSRLCYAFQHIDKLQAYKEIQPYLTYKAYLKQICE